MSSRFLFISVLLGSPVVQGGPCSPYSEVEKLVHCGPKGYPLAYGLVNCLRFQKAVAIGDFTPNGVGFVNRTASCLTNALQMMVKINPLITCPMLERLAFESHVTCYIQSDFCRLACEMAPALLKTFHFRDFIRPLAIKQVVDVLDKCGASLCKGIDSSSNR